MRLGGALARARPGTAAFPTRHGRARARPARTRVSAGPRPGARSRAGEPPEPREPSSRARPGPASAVSPGSPSPPRPGVSSASAGAASPLAADARGSVSARAISVDTPAPPASAEPSSSPRVTRRRRDYVRERPSSPERIGIGRDDDPDASDPLRPSDYSGVSLDAPAEDPDSVDHLASLRHAERRFLQLHPRAPAPGWFGAENVTAPRAESVTVVDGANRLWLSADGRVDIRRVGPKKSARPGAAHVDALAARTRLSLPPEANCLDAVIEEMTTDARTGDVVAATMRWGDVAVARVFVVGERRERESPETRAALDAMRERKEAETRGILRRKMGGGVAEEPEERDPGDSPAGRRRRECWCAKLSSGFVLDFEVNPGACERPSRAMAEIATELEPSGEWFGGGHLMRQHWPLNRGCWEVGPHYPFDNGPHGVNTLVASHFVSSGGLAVLADPETPYFHVGLNAPLPSPWDHVASDRSFGVGIQNAARLTLPMTHDEDRFGDGLLRLQARSAFHRGRGPFKMDHPMIGWEAPGFAWEKDGTLAGSVDEGELLLSGEFDEGEESDEGPRESSDDAKSPPVSWTRREGGSFSKSPPTRHRPLAMRVAFCAEADPKAATEACLRTLPRPSAPPPASVLRAPIWTTWAKFKHGVDQAKTLAFAREIRANGLDGSVMEIDDKWQSAYGDLDFDAKKFPDPKGMVEELHAMGFAVTLWVMPFVEENSEAYEEGKDRGYFVGTRNVSMSSSTKFPSQRARGFFKWWNTPPVVALDVTNDEAVEWFVERLERLRSTCGIDGFKFDAGEPCFLPRKFSTRRPLTHPSEYTRGWIERVASRFELAEVRTGHQTQGVGVLTRMGDRFSEWGNGNGLRSLIPTLLTSAVMGYPFCLPDMIGGNAYFGRRPDRELMTRWAQLNALMPAMQFSIAPWDAGEDVAEMIRDVMALRGEMVEEIVRLSRASCDALEPICAPLWWLDPKDPNTFGVADQFALGRDVVVAPVVVPGARTRDVYLPEGLWVEARDRDGEVYVGRAWLRDVHVPLEKLPCFVRLDAGAETEMDVERAW